MERLTPQQRLQIVQLYYENGRSVKSIYRALRPIYGVHNRPTERTIRHTIGKLENNLTLLDDTRPIRFGADLNNLASLMALLGRFLMPEIEARNLHDIWFQQDGATCHTARETMNLLRSRFGEQFISCLGPVDWPPRSCDII